MLGWFKKRPQHPLASVAERDAVLAKYHPIFREVDAAFHMYLEIVTGKPSLGDEQVDREMVRRGVEVGLAEECVTFVPMAWGRHLIEQLGVSCSPSFRLHSLTDGTERDLPLANEFVFAWARLMIELYRTPERNQVFGLIATRSAEFGAVNNALNGGAIEADLRGAESQPTLVHFHRTVALDQSIDAGPSTVNDSEG